MANLSLSLLGGFQARIDGRPACGFSSARVRALLAYLAVEGPRPHSRERIAGLLWPEQPERPAHNNLRQALANLRDVLGDHTAEPPFLKVTYDTLQLNPDCACDLDVTTFNRLLTECAGHVHRRPPACAACAGRLERAVELYQADFLADFFLKDNEPCEEWALGWRERLRGQAIDAMYRLAEFHELQGNYERAARLVARQLQFDPWREKLFEKINYGPSDVASAGS